MVCLLVEYAKAASGEDYRSVLDASVQCPFDVTPERLVDLVRRYAQNLQTWSPVTLVSRKDLKEDDLSSTGTSSLVDSGSEGDE